MQDLSVEDRVSRTQFQYTLEDADAKELTAQTARLVEKLNTLGSLRDVATDEQNGGLETTLVIDRDTASRLGIGMQQIDDTLYDAFGQRLVSTMFTQSNQYHVVLEVSKDFRSNPQDLSDIYIRSATGSEVPLSSFTRFEQTTAPLTINHQGQFPVVTISFNLPPGESLGSAVKDIQKAEADIGLPASIHTEFQGTAAAFQNSLANEAYLILAALVVVYIVLGVLYESYIHPITILSTLPSAGVGAILAIFICHDDFNVVALIGIILLIGIVKKNAIMMIDFALEAERHGGKSPVEAIYQACLLRFRPIMMTTMAALFGGLPLALGTGVGSELRRPLGITIVGGFIVSQVLTLYTTPVVYLFFDRLANRSPRRPPATRPRRTRSPHSLSGSGVCPMNLSAPFIKRPAATTLLTAALALSGVLAFNFLPVAPLPAVELPTISVHANLPGASPETMASSVATPLERQFGRIAGITEMTSSSQLGSTNINLQFDLDRNADAAARDVEAAINAARSQLPANMPSNPGYWKMNPANAPIMMLAITSDTYDKGKMYDIADSILAQKLAQIDGVGQVHTWGSSRPAVRVQLNPHLLNAMGLSITDVATALQNANAHQAKGALSNDAYFRQIAATDELFTASQYAPLIVKYNNNAPVRLADLGNVLDSVEDTRNDGSDNGKPSIVMMITKQPDANIIDTVDRIKAVLPQLQASVPPAMKLTIAQDRTTTIRASVHDVERTLLISIFLVILVVFVFLRNIWATIIPGIAVPLSLLGTFGVMYLLGYSLNNLSLMALTVSTGFVVDDAIVVIENITRYLEMGWNPMRAALQGAKEIGFTVLSMSTSLVAVFIPILLMGGIVGRLFREFAVTLTAAILISLVVSLTTTPMMCSKFLKAQNNQTHNRLYRISRTRLRTASQELRENTGRRSHSPAGHSCHGPRHRRRQRLSLRHRPQRLLPAAGHRPNRRQHRCRSEHLLCGHAREIARLLGHR